MKIYVTDTVCIEAVEAMNITDGHWSDEFKCSNCDFSCEIQEKYEGELCEYEPRYCPECGAAIVKTVKKWGDETDEHDGD